MRCARRGVPLPRYRMKQRRPIRACLMDQMSPPETLAPPGAFARLRPSLQWSALGVLTAGVRRRLRLAASARRAFARADGRGDRSGDQRRHRTSAGAVVSGCAGHCRVADRGDDHPGDCGEFPARMAALCRRRAGRDGSGEPHRLDHDAHENPARHDGGVGLLARAQRRS